MASAHGSGRGEQDDDSFVGGKDGGVSLDYESSSSSTFSEDEWLASLTQGNDADAPTTALTTTMTTTTTTTSRTDDDDAAREDAAAASLYSIRKLPNGAYTFWRVKSEFAKRADAERAAKAF